MKNDTRNRICYRIAARSVRVAVLGCFSLNATLTPIAAWADVPPPPPSYTKPIDTSFPSGRALERQGYDPKTGVWKVNVNKDGRPKVTSNGTTVTGSQNVRITATDGYGNKATIRGKVTQTVSNTATAMIAGNIIGNSISKASNQFGSELDKNLANGDYYGAAVNTARIVGGAIDNAFTGGFLGDAFGASGSSKAQRTADSIINNFYRSPPPSSKPAPPSSNNSINSAAPSSPSVNGSSASGSSSALSSAANAAAAAQSAAEKSGDIGGALGAAAVGKAAGAAAEASKGNEEYQKAKDKARKGKEVYQAVLTYTDYGLEPVRSRTEKLSFYTDSSEGYGYSYATYNGAGKRTIVKSSPLDGYLPGSLKGSGSAAVSLNLFSYDAPPPVSVKPSDMTLSEGDIADILGRMFASQQTNHAAMMSALSQIAANTAPKSPSTSESSVGSSQSSDSRSQVGRSGPSIVDKATTSYTVSGDTAVTAPYTPAGSNTPQQTQFSVAPDGTVSATVIPRPDLKPHSSQAPTRSSVAPSVSKSQDAPSVPSQNHGTQANTNQSHQSQQSGQNQQQQQRQDFCRQNPQSAACADMGEADYEDLEIPEETIDLKFEPVDVFATDGTCPAPVRYELGAMGSFEISYDYICSVLRMLRPIVILGTIISCSMFAYASVKEL